MIETAILTAGHVKNGLVIPEVVRLVFIVRLSIMIGTFGVTKKAIRSMEIRVPIIRAMSDLAK